MSSRSISHALIFSHNIIIILLTTQPYTTPYSTTLISLKGPGRSDRTVLFGFTASYTLPPRLALLSKQMADRQQPEPEQSSSSSQSHSIAAISCSQPSAPENCFESHKSLLRNALPASQPQEGSIGSQIKAFTRSELEELKAALPSVEFRPRSSSSNPNNLNNNKNMLDICQPWQQGLLPQPIPATFSESSPQNGGEDPESQIVDDYNYLDYYNAPRFKTKNIHEPQQFRLLCREGYFTGPTNGQCPGFLQCNLVVLPQGQHAFDFLLFCQRNPKACPLIEVCDTGSPHPIAVAQGADLRTDLPK